MVSLVCMSMTFNVFLDLHFESSDAKIVAASLLVTKNVYGKVLDVADRINQELQTSSR